MIFRVIDFMKKYFFTILCFLTIANNCLSCDHCSEDEGTNQESKKMDNASKKEIKKNTDSKHDHSDSNKSSEKAEALDNKNNI